MNTDQEEAMTTNRSSNRGARTVLLGLLGVCLGAVGPLLPVFAAGTDLRSAALRAGEVPAPFSTPRVATYPHYTDVMKVSTTGPAGSVDTTCLVEVPGSHAGWVQGLVEGFDTVKVGSSLRVCGILFTTARQAAAEYTANSQNIKSHISIGLERALPSHVGDRSVAAASKHTYDLVFLRGRAVFSVTYGGFVNPMSTSTFLKLGAAISSRLH
jgi:hypothetical protein